MEPDEIGADARVVVCDARALHLTRVLAVEPGRTLRAGIVDGPLGSVTVERATEREVVLDASGLGSAAVPERPRVDLLLALPRPKVLGRLYAALACVGIGRLILTNAARVERYYFDSHVLEEPFWQKRLREGLSQARDTRLPRVSVHRSFRKLIEDELDGLVADDFRALADVVAVGGVREALFGLAPGRRVLLAVGPEGGWVDFERALFAEHGFSPLSFGERVLRADVACIGALAVLHDELRHPRFDPR